MASPSRSRTRQADKAKAKADTITQDEIDRATSEESALLQKATNEYLNNRIASLRILLNRANEEIVALKAKYEPQPETKA